jgi:maleylacetate reductase
VKAFIYVSEPSRVVFARGSVARIADEARLLGTRALVLTTPEQSESGRAVLEKLGNAGGGIFNDAKMHVPLEVVDRAQAMLDDIGADSLVAVGGGSTIGLAKALALRTRLPILAVPTTYAGSEMTPIWGHTEGGRKITGRDQVVRPRTVLYDPDLVQSLPTATAAASGMNAIAHCCEALYAVDANPVTSLMAREGIAVLAAALPLIVADPLNREARAQAFYGAWLGGTVLGAVSMALHHKLCHTLGGRFNLPHAELHTALLPHAIAYNASAAPYAADVIANALGADDAATGLFDLAKGLGVGMALGDLGMPQEGIDDAVEEACASPYPNPRALEVELLRTLLTDAHAGRRPSQIH